ncbi:hypothetical protein Tco_1271757 [Tanacetum coccineum]
MNNNQKALFHLSLLLKSCLTLMTSSSMITMRFPSFTFLTQTQTTIKLSHTSSLNVVLGRHSQEHPTNTKRGILGEVGFTTFRNSIGANYLSHSTKYAEVPPLETVRAWFSTIGYKGKTGGFDQILNKDATILYFLSNGVDIDYARLIWEDIINKLNKKTREKVVPYPRFLSLLSEHKIEGYGNDNVTLNPTQVFSVHNWALKKNQVEGPPFTPTCWLSTLQMSLWHSKLLEPPQKLRRRLPKIEADKGFSLKGDTGSQTGHLVKETQSSSAKDTNQIQPLASRPVVAGMHKDF